MKKLKTILNISHKVSHILSAVVSIIFAIYFVYEGFLAYFILKELGGGVDALVASRWGLGIAMFKKPKNYTQRSFYWMGKYLSYFNNRYTSLYLFYYINRTSFCNKLVVIKKFNRKNKRRERNFNRKRNIFTSKVGK